METLTISEFACRISKSGSLRISAKIIAEMGLKPGDYVYVAYLSRNGILNDYREFLLSSKEFDAIHEEKASFLLPTQLMEQARIPADSDLIIACFDGMIVICNNSSLELGELNEILERLRTANEYVDYYGFDGDIPYTKSQLADTIHSLQEGGENNE